MPEMPYPILDTASVMGSLAQAAEKWSNITGAWGAAEQPEHQPCNVSATQQAPCQARAVPAARATATETRWGKEK